MSHTERASDGWSGAAAGGRVAGHQAEEGPSAEESAPRDDGPRRGHTIEDVAALAGVSRATVSRVLNGSSHVLPATRSRVLAAADELGFVPSLAARALAGGRGDRVAIVAISHPWCPEEDRFFGTVAYAAAEEAGAAGLGVFLRRLEHGDRAGLRELAGDRALAGLVVINPSRAALAALPRPVLRRTVTLGACAPDVAAIDVDNPLASQAALAHLSGLGRRRITLVAGPDDLPCARERTEAYLAHQAELGQPGRLVRSRLGVAEAAEALDASFDADGPPEAVFAAGDGLATAVVEVCHARGLRIGDDVAVVGFDDDPPPPGARRHAYAAVRSPVPSIAAGAVRMVASGDTRAEQRMLPPTEVGIAARPPKARGAAGRRAAAHPRASGHAV
ncbi:LacI family DNA-binding transcriptional regulator [Frankia sp. CNm7]|uniref:LacI family DNA-binding transcriptional regulator n=1 Tax=Frankia nepalensis TaxID=1836974 RepID=A0A937RHV4_9ACTN|nr:LacI family DNA-binding transcriptional regulator [Frankia nepalensis]MBL7499923.1 LacI family DNA-binding transcriptional regulator [Frankia nepalensis]MBL7511714.1 LacI family DNA-binding transcriptional regulator [Frankia nepalensis]MBL7523170.1 LacI family DNA-binding transcriptional regulator [Frankia nepalensis]MBL7632526.1 LacI family DNA-binding transcriptional regulator [Frankia nepalensis]